jgi:UDP-galactopyranose mutase
MLHHPHISTYLNTDYFELSTVDLFDHVIFTGPIDKFFDTEEQLQYRSLRFDHVPISTQQYQSYPVVNYPQAQYDHTRIIEYKLFPNNNLRTPTTEIVKEYPSDLGEPYYPLLNERNINLYQRLAEKFKHIAQHHFIGRLATFKYYNMDQAIYQAMKFCHENF